MSISRDGDFRASLDSLFQCLTVHVIIFSSCQLIEPPLATTCVLLLLSYHHALLRRVWVCLIYTIPIQLLHVAMQSQAEKNQLPQPLLVHHMLQPWITVMTHHSYVHVFLVEGKQKLDTALQIRISSAE